MSLDARRSWFRYHGLFGDLLQLELRRTEPGELPALHAAAAGWYAGHGYPAEAVRHAQAAEDWGLAARLLADHWVDLDLDGRAGTARELLAAFPAGFAAVDAELAAVKVAHELTWGSLDEAERQLALAAGRSASVPADRLRRFEVMLTILRLCLARQHGDLPAMAEAADRLLAAVEAPDEPQLRLGEDLRALALINLGITEFWAAQLDDAERHLEQGVALARRIGRPFLEFSGLAYQAMVEIYLSSSFAQSAERSRQVVELARQHGWTDEPPAGIAYMILAIVLARQGRLEEAESWIQRAERTVRAKAEPAAGLTVCYIRGLLELARGRDADALAALRAAERLAGLLAVPHLLVMQVRALLVYALVRLGETERAERALAGLGDQDRDRGEIRIAIAVLRLAQDDPQAAAAVLAPVLEGAAPVSARTWLAHAFMLEAIARDALGDPAAAGRAVERALDLAEPEGALSVFLIHPAPGLLERHARDCAKHAALISDIFSMLPAEPGGYGKMASPRPRGAVEETARLIEPLSQSEIRVLRYLPTNLSGREIGRELSVSLNTVRTHMRHIFAKLGVHRRTEAVTRARALGLLAPSPRAPRGVLPQGSSISIGA